MKVAIIGGAGVRVPLLVRALAASDFGITEISLFDIDRTRLDLIADLSVRMAGEVRLTRHHQPDPAIEGAAFVIASIRAGASAQRARDEATALAHDVLAQETVGAVGFAMALRSTPAMVAYAKLVTALAPSAWLINFTNPVSIVTQAVHEETGARVIGICDTPYELFEDAAHALGLPAAECAYDYFGLNHLGWLREIRYQGKAEMHRLWDDDAGLASVYREPLFEVERLRTLRLLPTEYLYYYYRPEVALDHVRRAGTSRGHVVAALTDQLFADLAAGIDDPRARYDQYLAARDASYMQVETGSRTPRVKPAWAELSGYDRIALMTMRAIVHDTREVIPLDVPNRGTLPFLDADDIIEVPCAVDRDGPHALEVAAVPEHCEKLIAAVKKYERATIEAALSGSRADRVRALNLNPLSGPPDRVPALVDALYV